MEIIRKIYAFFIDTVQTLLLVAAVFLVIYVFLFRPFQVNGESMYPTFKNKEYILTSIIALRFGKPRLGDVIVFKAPKDTEKDFIKRVIGVPGDTISLQDGSVYLNGRFLDESSYLPPSIKTLGGLFLKENHAVAVPPQSYFVLGDNRPYSSDSREWGFVPENLIIGQSFFAYWPLNIAGKVKNPYLD